MAIRKGTTGGVLHVTLLDSSGVEVTGIAEANWRCVPVQADGTILATMTGGVEFTVVEIDSTNAPGKYSVTFSTATPFAHAGEAALLFYDATPGPGKGSRIVTVVDPFQMAQVGATYDSTSGALRVVGWYEVEGLIDDTPTLVRLEVFSPDDPENAIIDVSDGSPSSHGHFNVLVSSAGLVADKVYWVRATITTPIGNTLTGTTLVVVD